MLILDFAYRGYIGNAYIRMLYTMPRHSVVADPHWHICLPHLPPRHQSKQKSQFIHNKFLDKTSDYNKI